MARTLIVTGAAATGKSTIRGALAADPRLLALDVDTLATGAAAVAGDRRDYVAFWRFLIEIGGEVIDNGLTPVFCGVCLPEQIVAALPGDGSIELSLLALVIEHGELGRRIIARGRPTGSEAVARHRGIDGELRRATVPAPHHLDRLDVSGMAPDAVRAAAHVWVDAVLPS